MSEHDPSNDDLVSAYLDGEATPDERALVEADPTLMARARLLRSVSDQVAAPVDIDRAVRATHIEAAIARSATAANVAALEVRRRRRNTTTILSAAAAALVVAIAVPILFLSRGDDDRSASSSFDAGAMTADDASVGDDGASDASGAYTAELAPDADALDDAAGDTAAAPAAATAMLQLGDYPDVDGLAAALRAGTDTLPAPAQDGTDPTTSTALTCAADLAEDIGLQVDMVGTATIDGDPVGFAVVGGNARLVVVEPTGCTLIHDAAL